ncbi:MAG TPA: helix-turn-helix domain-containing protein [Xanthobacteraceae bacterium]|jgi:DNA-binding CsgD family transcriptional regulator
MQLVNQAEIAGERAEGVAFFRAAKDLYRLATVTYFCANIPVIGSTKCYAHCVYSDTSARQFTSRNIVHLDLPDEEELKTARSRSEEHNCPLTGQPSVNVGRREALLVQLRERHGETALLGTTIELEAAECIEQKTTIARECRILANYFHGHVLRMNGYDAGGDILISARELDCLRWTAAGKTAWEASVILGITERTVRFHLNAAREKLNCATTTQAVAKAIVNQLIDV